MGYVVLGLGVLAIFGLRCLIRRYYQAEGLLKTPKNIELKTQLKYFYIVLTSVMKK